MTPILYYLQYFTGNSLVTEYFASKPDAFAKATQVGVLQEKVQSFTYKNQRELVESLNKSRQPIMFNWVALEETFTKTEEYKSMYKSLNGYYKIPEPYVSNHILRMFWSCRDLFANLLKEKTNT